MSQTMAALDAVWRVLAVGLVLGSGLPALFSLGVRQLALATEPGANRALHRPDAVDQRAKRDHHAF